MNEKNAAAFAARHEKTPPLATRRRHYLLWYVTAAGWLVNAAISAYKQHPGQALVSVAISGVSLLAAVLWHRQAKESHVFPADTPSGK